MSRSPDRLYNLLPAVHRMRDAEIGEPLRALLAVVGEQVDVVEDDIARLYDNWFIETCDDWVVPYIGDLIGFQPIHEAGEAGVVDTAEGRLRNRILIPRRELANTLGYRRRKGTLALLEALAEAVAGWPALAVEFYRRLGWTQHLNHLHLHRGRTLNLREGSALDLLEGPFDRAAHSVDVRRVNSPREPGRYNIPSVGVSVWRLKSYSVSRAPAVLVEGGSPHWYSFSALGNDTPLFTNPTPNQMPPHVTDESNVPVPIRRRALEERLSRSSSDPNPHNTRASGRFYGEGKSLVIYAPGWPHKNSPQPVSPDHVIPANLKDWHYRPGREQVGVDPVLGRMVFPPGHVPRRGVRVTYHYGFSADMGGGEYERTLSQPLLHTPIPVRESGDFSTINKAIDEWRSRQAALRPEPDDESDKAEWRRDRERLRAAVIEIQDSSIYDERLEIALQTGESLQIRAANRVRPVICLLGPLELSGSQGSRFTLDGVILAGHSLFVRGPDREDSEQFARGDLCDVTIRHATLVPGRSLECGCEPKHPGEPSMRIEYSRATVKIEHSIVGLIEVVGNEVTSDPVEILVSDSILDATSYELPALDGPDKRLAFARPSFARSTVLGEVHTHAIGLAENSIFAGQVCVARRQQGCVRFCYVKPGSRTPRRYLCQPETAVASAIEEKFGKLSPVNFTRKHEVDWMQDHVRHRVRPRFNSVRYGTPTYCQVTLDCAEEIARGAEDESEMGVFHDLFQPQRTANLRARLDEYAPAGMEAGILFAT